jgi:rhodanese-related sulfurtransferase
MTVAAIDCDELLETLQSGEPLALVDALPPISYAHSHLPGAINLPPGGVEPQLLARRLPDRDAEIVVYCSNEECESSRDTAAALVALGYTRVRHYAGGKDEWRRRGLPLERAGRPYDPGSSPSTGAVNHPSGEE